MRSALVEEFRERARIMIATEAASEGINLQFCSLVINYDLPWNPQRIEQRIGRCHRYGQKHDMVVVNFLNRNNAADKRVFEILSEKFRLFNGVFGASDEVLGSIESGVDFEKRIAEIYQNCRTPDEIQASFDSLQASLSQEIEEGLATARQKLLENFDAEVAEKLHVYKAEVAASLHRMEALLWELTRYMLAKGASFNETSLSFTLEKTPERGIPTGRYAMRQASVDGAEGAQHYHVEHPLARRLTEEAKNRALPGAELTFDLSGSGKNISVLRELKGKSGALAVRRCTLTALEAEDYLFFAGQTDAGDALDAEQARRLFDLSAVVRELEEAPSTASLEPAFAAQWQAALADVASRNAAFFDEEMDKLDRWAEERKKHLGLRIEEMDRAIRETKAEARKTAPLDAKVALQRKVKALETGRTEMRKRLFESQDKVDEQKDALLNEIEGRMRQKVEEKELFRVRWLLL